VHTPATEMTAPHLGCRILVVEDDIDIRESLTGVLEAEGLAVVAVANGEEALSYLRAAVTTPDFILLDLMMPIMDGFQFREEQRKDERLSSIPVIVLSGHAHARAKASDMGAAEVIVKPVTLDGLLQVVARFC
jgi:CheY-like chemotaxis protein